MVGKYIDWYLVELESRLRRRLPEALCMNLSDEVRQHLEASASESGKEEDAAERGAIERFGPPAKIAAQFIATHAPDSQQPLPKWPVIWAAVLTLWVGGWSVTGIYPLEFAAMVYGIILFGTLFCISSFQSRRARPWALTGVITAGALLTVTVLSLTWLDLYKAGGLGLSPLWQVSNYRAEMQAEMARADGQVAYIEEGIAAFRQPFDPRQDKFHDANGWKAPIGTNALWVRSGPPVPGNPPREGGWGFDHKDSREAAASAWRQYGSGLRAAMLDLAKMDSDNLRSLDSAQDVPLAVRFADYGSQLAPFAISWTLALLLVNLVCVWTGRLWRRVSLRLMRPA